jgi:hypothetical protein
VPAPTGDNRELLTVIAFMRAAAGKREELKGLSINRVRRIA